MKRNVLIAVAVLAGLLGLVLLGRGLKHADAPLERDAPPPIRVAVAPVTRGPIRETMTVGGTLQATHRVTLSAQMPAKVLQLSLIHI